MLELYQLEALEDNYIYVLKSGDVVAAVDPGEADPVFTFLDEMGWDLNLILCTHHHPDHVGGVLELKDAFDCEILGFEGDEDRIPGITGTVSEGDAVHLGEVFGNVLEIPGHTTGHIAYYFEGEQLLFCGDTLFSLGCGRLFEGTPEQMWESLKKLRALPDATYVCCGHEYTEKNGRWAMGVDTTNPALGDRFEDVAGLRADGLPTVPSLLGEEKHTNPFLRADDPEIMEYVMAKDPVECFTKLRVLKDQY